MTRLAIAAIFLCCGVADAATASFTQLTTGNGFGFQVFDVTQGKIVQFLEHPYRYLHPGPVANGAGVERRNLVYDLYFGARIGTTAGWMSGQPQSVVELVDQAGIIHTAGAIGGAQVDSYYFAPYGYAGNGLVALVKVTNTTGTAQPVAMFLNPNFHMGTATDPNVPGTDGEVITTDATAAIETGPGGGAMIYQPIGGFDLADCSGTGYTRVQGGQDLAGTPVDCTGTDITIDFERQVATLGPGASAWWGAAILFAPDGNAPGVRAAWTAFLAGRAPDQLLADARAEWNSWRTPPPAGLSPDETRIYRQAEATLRMAQILEPYTVSPVQKSYGMLLAALPPGQWHMPWVRDQAYATVALARMGHTTEARRALMALLDAEAGDYQAYTSTAYRISVVRYFGNGHEESDWNTDGPNVELDGWGLYLWAARTYVEVSGDTAWLTATTRAGEPVYGVLKGSIAAPLGVTNVDPADGMIMPDTSIWEAHWAQRKHFAYTTFAASRGLCDFAALAGKSSDPDAQTKYAALSKSLAEAARAHLLDGNLVLAASPEQLHTGPYHDGAVLESLSWHLYPASDPIVNATVASLATTLHVASGGLERNDTNQSTYDSNEWVFMDLRAAGALAYAGMSAPSAALIAQVTTQAIPNFDLLPELYNDDTTAGAIGDYAGATPMVGFGAGAFVLAMRDRAGETVPMDCGASGTTPLGPPPTDGGGGGCSITPGSKGPGAWLLVATALASARSMRRRTRRRA